MITKSIKEWMTWVTNKANQKQPIKLVPYHWVCSPAFNAGYRLLNGAGPHNSVEASEPAGYTFLSWIYFSTGGWVGAIYASEPFSKTTNIWTATAKQATSGVSILGIALYVRNDLV